MPGIKEFVGKAVSIEVTAGQNPYEGVLVDFGPDILIIFNSKKYKYYYINLAHLQNLKHSPLQDFEYAGDFKVTPINNEKGQLSFKKIIENAKDTLLEVYVIGNQSLFGYIINVLSDYLLFNSPVNKTMAINIDHIKYLALSNISQTYYTRGKKDLQVSATLNAAGAPTFQQQLNKMIGKIIVIDMGIEPNKTGLAVSVSDDFIELISANEETHLFNLNHVKMFY